MRVTLMMGWLGALTEGIIIFGILWPLLGVEVNWVAFVTVTGGVTIAFFGVFFAGIATALRRRHR